MLIRLISSDGPLELSVIDNPPNVDDKQRTTSEQPYIKNVKIKSD